METGMNFTTICEQFAQILNGKSKAENGVCTVSFHRDFDVTMLGKDASSILGVSVIFQSLGNEGKALNLVEAALVQGEVAPLTDAALQQGIIVSAIHNHWLQTESPQIMYVHIESVEPPLQFAHKMAYAFTQLNSLPIAKES